MRFLRQIDEEKWVIAFHNNPLLEYTLISWLSLIRFWRIGKLSCSFFPHIPIHFTVGASIELSIRFVSKICWHIKSRWYVYLQRNKLSIVVRAHKTICKQESPWTNFKVSVGDRWCLHSSQSHPYQLRHDQSIAGFDAYLALNTFKVRFIYVFTFALTLVIVVLDSNLV